MDIFSIKEKMKLIDLIESNPRMLLVLDRFDISLGFQEMSIQEACEKNQVDLKVFMLIVNLFTNDKLAYTEEFKERIISNSYLDRHQVLQIVSYLRNAHTYYLESKLPYVRRLLDSFIEHHKTEHTIRLRSFFDEYEKDVQNHMEYENNVVFPYIEKLCQNIPQDHQYNIDHFEDNHTNIEDTPCDFKNLLLKHFPPTKERFYRNQILFSLYDLEYDLIEHGRIEDKILIPIIKKMEQA